MPVSRPRPRTRTAVVTFLLVLVTAAALAAGDPSARPAGAQAPTQAAAQAAAQPATQDADAEIRLDSMTPTVTPDTKVVTATGRVTNTGKLPLENVRAYFWFPEGSAPLTNRGQLRATARAQPDTNADGRRQWPSSLSVNVATTLQPGATARFTIHAQVEDLRRLTESAAGAPGVYLVGIDVRGTPPGWGERITAYTRTFLPWLPAGDRLTPVEVAFLLPLVGQPDVVSGRNDTLLDTDDADMFEPGGRLSTVLDIGADHTVSYLVDPAVLDKAEVMADGYRTWALEGVVHTGSEDAAAWLEEARGQLATHDSLMLPYGDPDVAALSHNELGDILGRAVQESGAAVAEYHTSGTTIAWPGDGYADSRTLDSIAGNDATTVLLSQPALPDLTNDGTSPVASLVTAAGGLTALMADPALTSGGPGGNDNPLFVQQRFLAETALLALQDGSPAELRRVVAAFPRTWQPGPDDERLFDIVESTNWLRPVTASAVLSADPNAYGGPRAPYPASERKAELGKPIIDQLRSLSRTGNTYLELLADSREAQSELELAFLRATSMSWRRAQGRAGRLGRAIEFDMKEPMGNVLLIAPRLVTLSSETGRFPLTVANDTDEAMEVMLEVTPSDPSRIEVEAIEPVQVDPGRRATVSVTANVKAGGALKITARPATRNGTPIPGTVSETFDVQTKPYGQVGWVVIGFGVGLLFLASGFRIVRRIRGALAARREKEPSASSDKSLSATGSTADPAKLSTVKRDA